MAAVTASNTERTTPTMLNRSVPTALNAALTGIPTDKQLVHFWCWTRARPAFSAPYGVRQLVAPLQVSRVFPIRHKGCLLPLPWGHTSRLDPPEGQAILYSPHVNVYPSRPRRRTLTPTPIYRGTPRSLARTPDAHIKSPRNK
jgi:hypothetical protein